MPTYTAACLDCGKVQDYFRKLSESGDTPDCCDTKMTKILVAPMVSAMAWTGANGFHVPDGVNGVGTWIETGADYKKYLEKNNLIPSSEAEQEAKINAASKAADDRKQLKADVLAAYRKHAK